MAFCSPLPDIATSSSYCRCFRDGDYPCRTAHLYSSDTIPSLLLLETARRCPSVSASACGVLVRRKSHIGSRIWSLQASTLRSVDHHTVNGPAPASTSASGSAGIEIPASCYQIIGVPNRAEKDQIVKSVMNLTNAEVEEGYTKEAVVARSDLLLDVRDKLLFEPVYAGNTKEKIPPKSSLRIPWRWLPGALCLLQEVGEEKLVLDIGWAALKNHDVKPFVHDLILAMALAECAIAKTHFEKNQISQGFDALARAQCLLRSRVSLCKIKLLSEIEESLEELAPACTLEVLGFPRTPDNAERRRRAIGALGELIRQGLDVETASRIDDWPGFLGQALDRLMAAEIVDLLPWDTLAFTRKNKKSLESQNQRVVVDFDCFHVVMMAHIALGFTSRRTELISKARAICECLMASEGIDLKVEEAFCLFLLGLGNEAEVIERLKQLEPSSNSSSQTSLFGKKDKDLNPLDPPLEKWLKDAVLSLFSDTQDCSPSLALFSSRERKPMVLRQNKRLQQSAPGSGPRPLSPSLSSERKISEERMSTLTFSQYLGPAVKQLAPSNLHIPSPQSKSDDQSDTSSFSSQLNRSLGSRHYSAVQSWSNSRIFIERMGFVAVLGCIVFLSCKIWGMQSGRINSSRCTRNRPSMTIGSTLSGYRTKEIMFDFITKIGSSLFPVGRKKSSTPASLSSPFHSACCRPMALEEAEGLVRQWQNIKAEALGPDHQTQLLYDILDEPLLLQWSDLADTAKAKSCFWKFVLLQLSILRAEVFSDKIRPERAEIEVLLEEAAELVDQSQLKNPTYYSTYKIRYVLEKQDDVTWKFCEADIQPQV